MNLLLILTTVSQLVLVVLAQIPSSIDSQDGAAGIHLVMKTEEGDIVHLRPVRGAVEEDSAATPAINGNGDTQRVRNNRKGNKLQGSKKPLAAENASASPPHSHPKHKQGHKNADKPPRQGNKQQQHGHHHGAGKKTGAKPRTQNNASTCRYAKSAWSSCDTKTNIRTRVLSLKKGEQNCLPTRTIQKKCKKGCRYARGAWSTCNAGQMTREDKLQAEAAGGGSDQNCDPVRTVNKKCKANGAGKSHGPTRSTKDRKPKEKAGRRLSPHD
ncbi:uncharacterized protein miple2 [Drosophila kikkawai]|uniref:Uncharacterized protein miple2 n=1 Tax=Drosophila kikkawai TaxID=30033 RepID=A0A6P4J2S8_DROKI|nr:uncharacterized protein LOC108079092 [Drosophila kikkawai]XP_017028808.1 uncharacterized protein LOC108079092 [Drosophila kikkawai]